jgi:molybdopterin/thiamine biosynthesis adenylyltransferase
MDKKFSRQTDLVDMKRLEQMAVTIIGAGSIGSFTTYALAKMGVKDITVYDNDIVEKHNFSNQIYRVEDIGKKKVTCLKNRIKTDTELKIKAIEEKYENQKLKGIVISAVDSMETRETIWKNCKLNYEAELFIDVRVGGQIYRIYVVNPMDPDEIEQYETSLYPTSEVSPLKCTERSIIFSVLGPVAMVCNAVKDYVNKNNHRLEFIFDFATLYATPV